MKRPSHAVGLPWINDGAPTDLGSVPIAGERRLERLRAEGSHIAAADFNAYLCHMRSCILETKRLLDKEGVEEAHRQWNIAFGAMYVNLDWSVEDFEKNMDQAIIDYVLAPLEVETIAEARQRIQADAKDLNATLREYGAQRQEWHQDLRLEEVFWLLWRSKPRPDWMPDANKVPTEADIAEVKAYISYFLDDDDYGAIMRNVRGQSGKRSLDALTKSLLTEEMVQKKAERTSKPSIGQ